MSKEKSFSDWLFEWRKDHYRQKPRLKHYWQVELERVLRIQKELERRINERQILNDEQQENHRNAKVESEEA